MQDPLALAERRLAAGELRPALDALKEARAAAYEAGDRATLARIRRLALGLRPQLGEDNRAERSCAVLLFAVHESLELLPAKTYAAEEDADEPNTVAGPADEREEEPEASPEPEPAAEPEPEPPAQPEPYIGRSVVEAHVVEAKAAALEPGERLIGIFHGVVHETREDGGRGKPKGGVALDDYLLVTDRGIVLWARGRGEVVEGYRYAEITSADPVRSLRGRSVVIVVGGTRRWFASLKRDDAELAAELIRELAGLRPAAE